MKSTIALSKFLHNQTHPSVDESLEFKKFVNLFKVIMQQCISNSDYQFTLEFFKVRNLIISGQNILLWDNAIEECSICIS